MNYLRGAVSAISAPYHYYNKINPSTLTGAIDVIVVHRPTIDGGTELACSPFHVRFGKWQVLRPSDKRVRISSSTSFLPKLLYPGQCICQRRTNAVQYEDQRGGRSCLRLR